MMDLRKTPGEILDRVADRGEAFIVERSGQQMACLVPLSTLLPGIQQSRIVREFDALRRADEAHTTELTADHEIELKFRHENNGEEIILTVRLPHGYPSQAPKIFANPIKSECPHKWQDGSLCIFGMMEIWNPGKHDVLDVLALARQWLGRYREWEKTGQWSDVGGAS